MNVNIDLIYTLFILPPKAHLIVLRLSLEDVNTSLVHTREKEGEGEGTAGIFLILDKPLYQYQYNTCWPGNDDMIEPEAKGHKLDKEPLSRTHPHQVHSPAIWQGRVETAASDKLCSNKEYPIHTV